MSNGIVGLRGYQQGGLPEDSPGFWERRRLREQESPHAGRQQHLSGIPRLPLAFRQIVGDVIGKQVRERFGMEGLGNLIGSKDITAGDLTPAEYNALQDAVLRGMGGTLQDESILEYVDYATAREGEDQYSDVGGSGGSGILTKFLDPSFSVKATLGQARIVRGDSARGENPEHYYVDDQYNFNERLPDPTELGDFLEILKGRSAEQGAYGVPRAFGEAYGSPEGEGSMVRINLGDLQGAYDRYHDVPTEGIFSRVMGGIRGLLGRDDEEPVPEMVSAPPVETIEDMRRRDDQSIARLREQLGSPNISPPELDMDISAFDQQ